MSTTHYRLLVHAQGSLLLGGRSQAPAFLDASTAREGAGAGRPFVPGTALKGAIREAVGWIAAHRPDEPKPCTVLAPCPADAERFCAVCRIFGGADVEEERAGAERKSRGRVYIDDAHLARSEERPDLFAVRQGVSIDRKTGRAFEQRLFYREVADVDGLRFAADVEAHLEGKDREIFEQAVKLVDAIGNSRSRGLGRVRLELQSVKPVRSWGGITAKLSPRGRDADRAVVVVTAKSDLALGGDPAYGNVRAGADFVPGSTLRGAIGWAAARSGLHDDPGFAHFCEVARFSDLHPGGGQDGRDLATPTPRTLLWCDCSTTAERATMWDSILQAGVGRLLVEAGGRPLEANCPKCGRALRPRHGLIAVKDSAPVNSLPRRVVTGLALDRRAGSFAYGMVHGREVVAPLTQSPGTNSYRSVRLTGTASGIDSTVRRLIERITVPIRLGGARTRGFGRVEVKLVSYDREDLLNRLAHWNAQAQGVVSDAVRARLGLPDGGRWMQIVARTPLSVAAEVGLSGVDAWLAQTLAGDGASVTDLRSSPSHQWARADAMVVGSWWRVGHRSGWDDRPGHVGQRPVLPVLEAGATWLLYLRQPPDTDRLVDAETRGVGLFTELGLGRLLFCPRLPVHFPSKEG